jgi:hypothetical protein
MGEKCLAYENEVNRLRPPSGATDHAYMKRDQETAQITSGGFKENRIHATGDETLGIRTPD